MEILYYKDLDYKHLSKKFNREIEHLKSGNFKAAEVKKMPETSFYRAKLDHTNRLLFRFAKYKSKSYLLLLEVITNHDYSSSCFLRGAAIDESKLLDLNAASLPEQKDVYDLPYIHKSHQQFHMLDKIICFDDDQHEILSLPLPLLLIGSAGSGKTALALEKMKTLTGSILYVTLSPYLAEYATRLYYSNNYENENQEIDFLSFGEFLETIRIPEGKKINFKDFERWFTPHRPYSKVKDAHQLFEEFNGVITGFAVDKGYLNRADYVGLGIKQSVFLQDERNDVYDLFEKYISFLKEQNYYDINMISYQWLAFCKPHYDYIFVDEVQDYTNIQLFLILKSLSNPSGFLLCGDSNQIVHPNFFSWGKIRSMFYSNLPGQNMIRILTTNYRNSLEVTAIANRLLKIKNARFGSIDRESTYLIRSKSLNKGEVLLLDDSDKMKAGLNEKTKQSIRYAVLVMRNEDKADAARFFNTPLIFSIQEAKGLEYENIILYNFVSRNEKVFREIASEVTIQQVNQDEIIYGRAADKTDKSLEVYKFFINSLFVGITRAIGSIYVIEKNHQQPLLSLLELTQKGGQVQLKADISSKEDWNREAQRLEKQGRAEQAESIRKTILHNEPVPWKVLTPAELENIKVQALNPNEFNKKAKDLLFDYALVYHKEELALELVKLQYKRAEKFESERSALMRGPYVNFASDNPKMVLSFLTKYGVDYRNIFNQTPLMISAWTGSTNIITSLLDLGASTELTDNLGRNALQTAFLQTYHSPLYTKNKFGKIYSFLKTESICVKTNNQLIKINNQKAEYLLLNMLIGTQKEMAKDQDKNKAYGFNANDIASLVEQYPENIMPAHRKKQSYISAILAKNEVLKEDALTKKLFLRIEHGYYVLSPDLDVLVNEQWMNVYDLMQTVKITYTQNKIMKVERLFQSIKEMEVKEKGLVNSMDNEYNKYQPSYEKIGVLKIELQTLRRELRKSVTMHNEIISEMNRAKGWVKKMDTEKPKIAEPKIAIPKIENPQEEKGEVEKSQIGMTGKLF